MTHTPFNRAGMVYRPRFGNLLEHIVAVRQPANPTTAQASQGLDGLHADPKFQEVIKQPVPGLISVKDEPAKELPDGQ